MNAPRISRGRFSGTVKRFRRRGPRSDARRRPINVLANFMTTMNLYCGVSSIFAAIGGDFEKAALFILGAIFFDMADGWVARLTNSTSEFGKELDSLCDVVSFGIAPAVLVFVDYLHETNALTEILSARQESVLGKTGAYIGIIYAICAALRLARYNTFQSDRRDSFVGLPSPAAGGTIAVFILFLEYFAPRLQENKYGPWAYYLLGPLAVILALLMVSTVLYPKGRLKNLFILKPQHAFRLLGIGAFVIAVVNYAIAKSPYIVLFPLALTYVLFGIGDTLYLRFTRSGGEPVSTSDTLSLSSEVTSDEAPSTSGEDADASKGGPAKNDDAR